ncbi:MAG: protein phosphatase 2C domain-containing protein [Kineosporiaceae bacterium]|nr:protein phosphatase 2C domain-containing protein [Kineosporiaceae bacterium]
MSEVRVRALRVVITTRRNTRRRNDDAVGVSGWALHGDGPDVLDVLVPLPATGLAAVAVADGLGGHRDGDRAARIAVQLLSASSTEVDASAAAAGRLVAADAAVHAAATGESAAMGCTAALLVTDALGRAAVGNVGDVRAYRVVDGFAGELTQDDRPDGAPTGVVLSCLGGRDPSPIAPHVSALGLGPGDRILLCSDGVHDVLDEVALAGYAAGDATRAVTAVASAAVAAGSQDNVTAVLVDLFG